MNNWEIDFSTNQDEILIYKVGCLPEISACCYEDIVQYCTGSSVCVFTNGIIKPSNSSLYDGPFKVLSNAHVPQQFSIGIILGIGFVVHANANFSATINGCMANNNNNNN